VIIRTEDTATATSKGRESSTLKKLIVESVKWQVLGQVVAQVWRLITNLILTRLLLPEAFGIMALIFVCLFGLRMLSDVGLRDTVIHHRRGDCPEFLNTVWTIQVIRGFIMWVALCIGAVPFAAYYDEPALAWLLPIAGIGSAVQGFASTSLLTSSRHLLAKWSVIALLAGNFVGTMTMIVLAAVTHHVIALVIGSITNALAFVYVSFLFGEHKRHRFQWDKEAVSEVSRFGRWIIPSSGLTVFLLQGDRLVLGKVLPMDLLGLYSIGANLAGMPLMVFDRIMANVLQPVYAKIQDLPLQEARSKIRRFRLAIFAGFLPTMCFLMVGSYWIFDWLYELEYISAYRYCSIVALGIILRLSTDMGPLFQAIGQPRKHFSVTLVRCVVMVIGMALGYVLGGNEGALYGLSLSPLGAYPYQAMLYRQVGMWQPAVDAVGVLTAALSAGATLMWVL
jgi:O-antigen/teichoic acid export membrane protein